MPDRPEPTHQALNPLMEDEGIYVAHPTPHDPGAPKGIVAHEAEEARQSAPEHHAPPAGTEPQHLALENTLISGYMETHGPGAGGHVIDGKVEREASPSRFAASEHHAPPAGTEPQHEVLRDAMISGYMETHSPGQNAPGAHIKFDGIDGEANDVVHHGGHAVSGQGAGDPVPTESISFNSRAGGGANGFIKFDGIDGEANVVAHPGSHPSGERHAAAGTPHAVFDDTDIAHVARTSAPAIHMNQGNSLLDDGPSTLLGSPEFFDKSTPNHGTHQVDLSDPSGHTQPQPGHPHDAGDHLLHIDHTVTAAHLDTSADAAAHALNHQGAHHGHAL